jgi:hypothetical protein
VQRAKLQADLLIAFRMGFLNTISIGSQSDRRFASTSTSGAWLLSDDLASATDTLIFPLMQ